MDFLRAGHFSGGANRTIPLSGITLTDTVTEHAPKNIEWQCRQRAYFTFILQGALLEGSKKKSFNCSAGNLLLHSPQEPHYKIKPDGNTKCFHIEFDNEYFEDFPFGESELQGISKIENPDIKFLFYKLFRETRIQDDVTPASIQMLLFEIIGRTMEVKQSERKTKPRWAERLAEILHEDCAEKISAKNLSVELDIHPFHLSRDFPKYFHCTFGEYVRKVRIEKALSLFPNKNLSLTKIAFECGFADQSHFLRCFKLITGIKPSVFKKLLIR